MSVRPIFRPTRAIRRAVGFFLLCASAASAPAEAPRALAVPASEVLSAISESYGRVTNISLHVRREIGTSSAKLISRVFWARGDRMNVETLPPFAGRTVLDGTNVTRKLPGDTKPVVRPISEQSPAHRANERSVPGSPCEDLAPWDPASAEDLPPEGDAVRKIAMRLLPEFSGKSFASAVLSLDSEGRVLSLVAYADDTRKLVVLSIEYELPSEPVPGVWIYRKKVATSLVDGRPVHVVTRFDDIEANGALPDRVFDADAFF